LLKNVNSFLDNKNRRVQNHHCEAQGNLLINKAL